MIDIRGVFPPIVTPFTASGEVDYESIIHNIKKLNKTGLAGYVVLGSNGEYVYLSYEEKLEILKTVKKAADPDKMIIAGTGCESAIETIRLSREAKKIGSDACLIVNPSYYSAEMKEENIIEHYTSIADSVDLPVLLYNVPNYTGINLNPGLVLKLSSHPNIAGIKDSSGNIAQLCEIIDKVPDDFNVLVGTASVFYFAILAGARGGILALANIAPEESLQILKYTNEGSHSKALELQKRMLHVNKAVTAVYGVPGLKYAMGLLGYKGGYPRLPLKPLAEEKAAVLSDILRNNGLKY